MIYDIFPYLFDRIPVIPSRGRRLERRRRRQLTHCWGSDTLRLLLESPKQFLSEHSKDLLEVFSEYHEHIVFGVQPKRFGIVLLVNRKTTSNGESASGRISGVYGTNRVDGGSSCREASV